VSAHRAGLPPETNARRSPSLRRTTACSRISLQPPGIPAASTPAHGANPESTPSWPPPGVPAGVGGFFLDLSAPSRGSSRLRPPARLPVPPEQSSLRSAAAGERCHSLRAEQPASDQKPRSWLGLALGCSVPANLPLRHRRAVGPIHRGAQWPQERRQDQLQPHLPPFQCQIAGGIRRGGRDRRAGRPGV